MTEAVIYKYLLWAVFAFAVVTFIALRFITAPYGRHAREGWGPTVPHRVGWIAMELVPVIGFAAVFFLDPTVAAVPLVLFGLWQVHYIHRALIFPFMTRSLGKRMPVVIMLAAMFFNGLNTYLNARWISHFGEYSLSWLTDPRFVVGVVLFVAGLVINIHSDRVLIRLREPGETSGYKVPRDGFYRWVSAPNYLGEIIEWIGWAVATWSPAGLAFAVYTAANLIPRALDNHQWYRETFEDYPEDRKALVPHVL